MRTTTSMLALAGLACASLGIALADEAEKKADDKGKGASALTDRIFEKMDANGDGSVSREELSKFFGERLKDKGKGKAGDLMATVVGRMFDKLDANGDGKLTKEELAKLPDALGGTFKDKGGKLFDKLKDKLKGRKKGDD
jgi:Ca2+-binding EF-hand superfamily protein